MVPDVSFENLAEKHIYKYIWKDILDMPSLKKVIFTFLDIRDLVTNLPKRINKVIKKLEDKNDKSSFNLKTQKVYLKTMNTFLFVVFWGILFFAIYRMIELKLSLLHIILFSFAYILGLIFYLIFFSK